MTDSSQKLDAYDLLLLILYASSDCQRVSGRTTIQKIGYFACGSLNLENDYVAHYYGPYSPTMAYTLKRMVSLHLVKEESVVTNNDHLMFEYSLTPSGIEYAEKVSSENRNALHIVNKIVEKVAELEGDKIERISKAAKVHFLTQDSKDTLQPSEIIQKAKKLGWSIDQSDVKESLELMKEI